MDIMEGKCVRLASGNFSSKVEYKESPAEVAKRFEEAGLKRIHIVDLDGARQGKVINFRVLEQIAAQTKLVIDFGGGIKSSEDVKIALNSGAAFITTGSIAFKDKPLLKQWIEVFGAQIIIAAADARNEKIAVAGWQQETGIPVFDGIKEIMETGIKQILCTDISRDGNLAGPASELYKKILDKCPGAHLIASGGISAVGDIEEVENAGCAEVIIGKALYEGIIKLSDLKPWIDEN